MVRASFGWSIRASGATHWIYSSKFCCCYSYSSVGKVRESFRADRRPILLAIQTFLLVPHPVIFHTPLVLRQSYTKLRQPVRRSHKESRRRRRRRRRRGSMCMLPACGRRCMFGGATKQPPPHYRRVTVHSPPGRMRSREADIERQIPPYCKYSSTKSASHERKHTRQPLKHNSLRDQH
jgi:hypothetical protein